MDFSFRFDWWYARLAASPRDAGRVVRCVLRPTKGTRATPESIRVTRDGGIEGDRWAVDPNRRPGNQVSLINVHVIESLSEGDADLAAMCGDNLFVDLDLSEANLPVGTTLTIGEAVLEISPDPHRPCRSFHERFGATASKKVARANRVGKRGRGVLASIVHDGEIRVGDVIYVKRPGTACLS